MSELAISLLKDPAEVGILDDSTIQWLLRQGVSTSAIAGPWAVRAGRVIYDDAKGRYTPNRLGEFALVMPVLADPSDTMADLDAADLVAWSPRSGRIGTRLGRSAALGEGQLAVDGLGTTGLPVPIHRTPLGWLRANRHGLVIADTELARHLLAGVILEAEDTAHAAELVGQLRVPAPEIVVRRSRRAA